MKALITAAGLGTRLEEMKHTNKCLLKVGNKSIIERSISALKKYGIDDLYIVTGHYFEKVEKELEGKVAFIFNPFYKMSGIVVSIWFAKNFLYKQDFIFLTGDLLYDSGLIKKLLGVTEDIVMPIEKKDSYDHEDSKVIIDDGRIIETGKNLPLSKVSGEFCGIIKFSAKGSALLFDKIESFLRRGKLNTYFMDVLNELIADGVDIIPVDITGIPRMEIDFLKDLEYAREKLLALIDQD